LTTVHEDEDSTKKGNLGFLGLGFRI
jgi:hypothetical protein